MFSAVEVQKRENWKLKLKKKREKMKEHFGSTNLNIFMQKFEPVDFYLAAEYMMLKTVPPPSLGLRRTGLACCSLKRFMLARSFLLLVSFLLLIFPFVSGMSSSKIVRVTVYSDLA